MRRSIRIIAVFEAIKGIAVLAASVGLLGLMHHDVRHLAVELIGHFGLNPGARYPSIFLHYADMLHDANLRSLLLFSTAYVGIRLAEAYGLWNDLAWAEWLGALSGALYIPFEIRHLLHRPNTINLVVLLANLLVVLFLGLRLWRRRGKGTLS